MRRCNPPRLPTALLTLVACVASGVARAAGHCAPGEVTYFACTLQSAEGTRVADEPRVVSLCGGESGADGAWLQFRSGPSGRPDLVVPATRRGSRDAFTGEHLVRDGAPVDSVWFRDGRVGYGLQSRNPVPAWHGLWEMRGRVTRQQRCAAAPDDWNGAGAARFTDLVRSLPATK